LDEARQDTIPTSSTQTASPLAQLSQVEGVEFVLAMKNGEGQQDEARGLENPEVMATWARQSLERFRALGDRLQTGSVEQIECQGPQRNVALAHQSETDFCVGWKNSMNIEQIREMMKKVLALWAC